MPGENRSRAGFPGRIPPDFGVADSFQYLLDATLRHLQDLRTEGVPYLSLDKEGLGRLLRGASASMAAGKAAHGPVPVPSPSHSQPTSQGPMVRGQVFEPRKMPPDPAPFSDESLRFSLRRVERLPEAGGPVPPPSVARVEPVADRNAAMEELRRQALVCQQCPHLVKTRTQVVFGVGSVEAELMFVGEAPGADEDRLGEPFVGRAGQLLTKIIAAMGFSRETVYIANILKCRPDLPEGSRGNRPPRPEEMDTCKPYLVRQIEIIRPKVIVALGNTSVQGLLNVRSTMGSVRGRWQDFRGVPVMPTFHPSYLLRSEDGPDRGFGEKRKTWTDMLLVLERLGRPITEKMRGYFLKPGGG